MNILAAWEIGVDDSEVGEDDKADKVVEVGEYGAVDEVDKAVEAGDKYDDLLEMMGSGE